MKTGKSILIIASMLAITFVSCKKDRADQIDEIETTFELSENQAVSDNLNEDAGEVMEEAAARNNLLGADGSLLPCGIPAPNWIGACATITVSGNFPAKTIRIDFGNGCTSPNGVVRKGVINIVLTDSVRKPGSVATTTFENYYVNQFKKEGTIVRTNTTVAGSNTRSFNRTVTNGKITGPNGKVWQHTSNINLTQTAGVNTPCILADDVYTLDGTRTVINALGKTRTSATQTPLQKKRSCNNIDQGILRVQGTNHFAIIDFGNGNCDNQATISIDGRPSRTIFLR
jgi:FlaG/FlaF family flagellin (archaellin)